MSGVGWFYPTFFLYLPIDLVLLHLFLFVGYVPYTIFPLLFQILSMSVFHLICFIWIQHIRYMVTTYKGLADVTSVSVVKSLHNKFTELCVCIENLYYIRKTGWTRMIMWMIRVGEAKRTSGIITEQKNRLCVMGTWPVGHPIDKNLLSTINKNAYW